MYPTVEEGRERRTNISSNLPILKLVQAIETYTQSGFMIPLMDPALMMWKKKESSVHQEADLLEHLFTDPHYEGSDDTPVSRRTLHSVALARQPILSCREGATGRGA